MIQKTLLIGSGFLGSYIKKEANLRNLEIISTYFSKEKKDGQKLDITNYDNLRKYVETIEPDLIINCAALTNIDFLENHPEQAYAINSDGAKNVAQVSNEFGIRLIHISTDSVFDGNGDMYTEKDQPNPLNVYAKSKLLGETKVSENSKNYVIVRTNFLGIDKEAKYTFSSIYKTLENRKNIIGFNDVIYTPLYVLDLNKWILDIANTNYNGIIHLSSDKSISKYQICLGIAETFSFDKKLIRKGSIDDIKFLAKRSKNTSLSNKKAKDITSTSIVSFEEFLEQIKNQTKMNS